MDSVQNISPDAMHKFSYGLFVLTAKEGNKDNGCIINTAIQLTDNPKRISIAVNKSNYTHDMIINTGRFNISVLTIEAPFKVFEHFGYQSGRNTDKFAGFAAQNRTSNGVLYIGKYTNAVISGKVIKAEDVGTHTLFIAEVTEALTLSAVKSVTYEYYFESIKPKPEVKKKSGFVCKICGYVYEGDELPADFICLICKHGADAFERIEASRDAKSTDKPARKFVCAICGCVYDEAVENLRWEELPDDWTCPVCGVPKENFELVK